MTVPCYVAVVFSPLALQRTNSVRIIYTRYPFSKASYQNIITIVIDSLLYFKVPGIRFFVSNSTVDHTI